MTATDARRPHRTVKTGSPAERFTSRDWSVFAEPQGKDEAWRFTPLREIRDLMAPFDNPGRLTLDIRAPESVIWSMVPSGHALLGQVLEPADRASAIAWENAEIASVIELEEGTALRNPVIVRMRGESGTAYSHVVVKAAARSKATVILEYVGSCRVSANVEIIVEDEADLTLVSLHNWDDDTVHLANHTCTVGRGAALKHVVVNIGGRIVRTVPSVKLAGPHATVQMLGVGIAGDNQHMESRLYVDHAAPGCTSNVMYKNVLVAPTARTVWIGDVRIRPEAVQTSTYEMNRNLILRNGARADSVPNLEIETGDVEEAGHASATGRFDDEQLFYLEARGIPRNEAQQLVVRGFLADVISTIDLQSVRDHIMFAVDSRLAPTPQPTESAGL